MKTARMPKHLRDLIDAGYDLDAYFRARKWFADRGVQASYSTIRRSWSFMAIGRANGPTTVICWVGIEAFIDMLDAPAATLKAIAQKGGNVAKRKAK